MVKLPTITPKEGAYSAHVADCRECDRCTGVTNLTGCAHPSPWALWLGSLDARVVVVGQDFSGTDRRWTEPKLDLPTNRNLRDLVAAAGLDAARDVYLTNAVLCLKPGRTSRRVPVGWLKNCAPLLRRTIEVVRPQAVAALGVAPWRALREAFRLRLRPLGQSVGGDPVEVPGGPALFAFNHCGGLGVAHRSLPRQKQDWQLLGQWLAMRPRARV